MSDTSLQVMNRAGHCPFCRDAIERAERIVCAACLAPHHDECWAEHGACASCTEQEALRTSEPPASPPTPVVQVSVADPEPFDFQYDVLGMIADSLFGDIDPDSRLVSAFLLAVVAAAFLTLGALTYLAVF